MRYRFERWEDGSTNPSRTLTVTADLSITAYYTPVLRIVTYQSTPIAVQAMIGNTPVPSGNAVEVQDGAIINITVPAEVEAS